MKSDIVIVGAGASGLMCASFIAYRLKSMGITNLPEITLVERNDRVGRKILATGNGRCNMTNLNLSLDKYNTDDYDKLKSLFDTYSNLNFLDYIRNTIGVEYIQIDSWVYPLTLRSNTVLDSLRSYINDNNVRIITDAKVIKITAGSVITDSDVIEGKHVVVAVGGASYPNLGTDGSSYFLSDVKSSDFTKPIPALVPLKLSDTDLKALQGIKHSVNIKVDGIDDDTKGEILFTDYGISGICTMQISGYCNSYAQSNGKYPKVTIDLMPDFDNSQLFDLIRWRQDSFPNRTISSALSGLIRDIITDIVLKRAGIKCSNISELSDSDIRKLVNGYKNLSVRISGSLGFDNSQVTRGGIKLSSLDNDLMYKNGLYYIGEVVNVDGQCGGYNLQWAWTSAMAVADAISRKYE